MSIIGFAVFQLEETSASKRICRGSRPNDQDRLISYVPFAYELSPHFRGSLNTAQDNASRFVRYFNVTFLLILQILNGQNVLQATVLFNLYYFGIK